MLTFLVRWADFHAGCRICCCLMVAQLMKWMSPYNVVSVSLVRCGVWKNTLSTSYNCFFFFPSYNNSLILSFYFHSLPVDFLIYLNLIILLPTPLTPILPLLVEFGTSYYGNGLGDITNDVVHGNLYNHPLALYWTRHLESPFGMKSLHISHCWKVPGPSLWVVT